MDTPYPLEDLPLLKFAQSADTMFLTHPSHPPRTLTRHDHHIWKFKNIVFYPSIAAPTGLKAAPSGFDDSSGTYRATTVDYKVSAVNSREIESMPSDAVTADVLSTWPSGAKVDLEWNAVAGAVRYEVYKDERGYYAWIGSADTNKFTDNSIEGDESTGPKENRDPFNPLATPSGITLSASGFSGSGVTARIRVSSLSNDGVESIASAENTIEIGIWTEGSVINVKWNKVPDAGAYRVYLNYTGEWRCYEVDGEETEFDIETDSSFEDSEPKDQIGSYPGAVGIYQQRLIFGRSNDEPQTVWCSETGAFDSMAVASCSRPLIVN